MLVISDDGEWKYKENISANFIWVISLAICYKYSIIWENKKQKV
jgi:hypothetical protein